MREPSPVGRGLERTAAKPSFLRERVWVDRLGAASPPQPADPHPALRATFSQGEKERFLVRAAAATVTAREQ